MCTFPRIEIVDAFTAFFQHPDLLYNKRKDGRSHFLQCVTFKVHRTKHIYCTEQSSQVENSHWTTTLTNLILHSLQHIQHTPWNVVTAVPSAFKLALPPASTCGLWKMSNKTVKLFKLMGDALPVHWFREVLQRESIKIRNSVRLLYGIQVVVLKQPAQTDTEEKRRWYGQIWIT